jgi:NTE family protein
MSILPNHATDRPTTTLPEPGKVGLALGGGVARGPAHVGVLTALLEAGIPIDMVAGTSAGALVGAIFCTGITMPDAAQLAHEIGWAKLARLAWPGRGLIHFRALERWLIQTIGDLTFADLLRPLAVCATDLESGEAVHLTRGRIAPAVHASCVVPGVVETIRLEGRLLGDGSLVNTIPVGILRQMGASYVIGVDLFRPKVRRGLGFLGHGLNALEITFQHAGGGYDQADCTISPDLAGMSYFNFRQARQLIDLGRRAAEAALPAIQAALHSPPPPGAG